MTDIYLRRVAAGFVPADDQSAERLRRFSIGEVVRAAVTKPRSLQHHRKLFALLKLIAENSDVYDTTEKALTGLKIVTGYVDFLPHPGTGELVAVPRSISFAALDQIEFAEWYEQAIGAACRHMVPQMNRMDAEQALDMVAAW